MELVLKTSGQQCLVGSNPTASAIVSSLSSQFGASNDNHGRLQQRPSNELQSWALTRHGRLVAGERGGIGKIVNVFIN